MEPVEFIDKKVFETSYREYYSSLCRFAYRYLDSESESKDLVQDLFVDIWANREKIKITTSVKSYLYAAVRNRSLTKLKSKLGIVPLLDDNNELVVEPVNLDFPSLEEAIQKAIASLPEKCRTIFVLSREQGLKYAQVAEKLNLSEKTVENQIGIALTKLREATKEFFSILLMF